MIFYVSFFSQLKNLSFLKLCLFRLNCSAPLFKECCHVFDFAVVVGLFRGCLPRGIGDWYVGLRHGPEQRGPLLDVEVVLNEAAGWRLLSEGGGSCRRRRADLN